MERGKKARLKMLVEQDELKIVQYLSTIKITQFSKDVKIRFSKQSLDESASINKFKFMFKNLCDLHDEPQFVRVQFEFEYTSRSQLAKYLRVQEGLINKIVSRSWLQHPTNPQSNNDNCNDPRVVKLYYKQESLKVLIIASLNFYKHRWS